MLSQPSLQAVLQLCRVSNAPTVWSNVLAAWFLSGGTFEPALGLMLLGATALYFGGTTLNDAADADFDRQYRPERPIPSGVFSRGQVTALGLGWMLLGSVLTLLAGGGWILLVILIACVLSYDLVHKRTTWAALLMGGGRASLFLLAASPHEFAFDTSTVLLAMWGTTHFIYITGLTWRAASESGPIEHKFPRLQSLLLATPLGTTLLGFLLAAGGLVSLIFGVGLAVWTIPAWPMRVGGGEGAMPPYKSIPRLLAGIVLIDGIALCWISPVIALGVVAILFPFALAMQKRIAAT
ncbi:UbiA family prenyltransferase [Cerasicoccus arenae]|uniref:4-hydroxybenzoate polyprenyltransferase n=1 Tax=Cerasicoccus arenae TaxID=424488 RepID=A0A8J3DJR7_9BACT|nr:UbiA family prenyltransferase [Cerasicoccus arenae]MBK1857832.1 UbiA family prenyltransferase [Cerasicoccus arenae]GHC11609.1 hypothetical protein GCM10007047_31110 [Cerasicoccus arenae]